MAGQHLKYLLEKFLEKFIWLNYQSHFHNGSPQVFLTVSNYKTVFASSHCTRNYNDILNKIFQSNAIKLFKWIKAKQMFLKGPDQKPIHCWIFLSLLLQLTIIITWLYSYIDCNIFITLYYTIVLYFIRLD